MSLARLRILPAAAAVALTTVALTTAAASAGTIYGYQETDGGKVVNLSGLEWITWDETNDFSRSNIEAGFENSFLADGWRYATRTEFEALFDSLWGGVIEGWDTSNHDGAAWLYTTMALQPSPDRDGLNIHFGDCGVELSCYGHVNADSTEGWFDDDYGLSTGVDAINAQTTRPKSTGSEFWYSALVRDAPSAAVPVPAAAPLLAAGLAALAALSRRRARAA